MLMRFAMQNFLEDRELKNVQPVTIKGYKRTLDEFGEFCVQQQLVDTSQVTKATLKSYFLYCKNERGNNPVTLNHKLITLRAFFNYLTNDLEMYKPNTIPTKGIERFKTDVKIEVFTDEQIRQVLKYFYRMRNKDKTLYSFRNVMMVWLLLGTGARLAELVRLRWRDVDFEHETIALFGKNRTAMNLPLANKLKRELAEYHVFVQHHFNQNLPEYVLTDAQASPLKEDAVKCVFKRAKTVLNFQDVRLSAHTFRHTFAHRCIMAGMDIYTLQRMMRHSDLSMVQRYLALWGTALKEQNDKYNPLNTLRL